MASNYRENLDRIMAEGNNDDHGRHILDWIDFQESPQFVECYVSMGERERDRINNDKNSPEAERNDQFQTDSIVIRTDKASRGREGCVRRQLDPEW